MADRHLEWRGDSSTARTRPLQHDQCRVDMRRLDKGYLGAVRADDHRVHHVAAGVVGPKYRGHRAGTGRRLVEIVEGNEARPRRSTGERSVKDDKVGTRRRAIDGKRKFRRKIQGSYRRPLTQEGGPVAMGRRLRHFRERTLHRRGGKLTGRGAPDLVEPVSRIVDQARRITVDRPREGQVAEARILGKTAKARVAGSLIRADRVIKPLAMVIGR